MNASRWVFLYTVILHVTWAVVLSTFAPVRTTAISLLLSAFGSAGVAAAVLIVSTVLALAALGVRDRPLVSFLLLTPQQFLVTISAVGAIIAVGAGRFPDGVIRPHEFILADQAPAILLAVMHAGALLERYAWRQSLFTRRPHAQ